MTCLPSIWAFLCFLGLRGSTLGFLGALDCVFTRFALPLLPCFIECDGFTIRLLASGIMPNATILA